MANTLQSRSEAARKSWRSRKRMAAALAGKTVHVAAGVVWDADGNEVGRRSYSYQNPDAKPPTVSGRNGRRSR